MYWGQDNVYNVDGSLEKNLVTYCTTVDVEIFIISSINQFGGDLETAINLSNHCVDPISCPAVGAQKILSKRRQEGFHFFSWLVESQSFFF